MKALKTIAILGIGVLTAATALAGAADKGCPTGVCSAANASSDEGFVLLTSGEMKKIVDAKSATILDARSGNYDDGQRIPGAKALNDKSSKEEIAKILPDKAAPIVTYCSNLKCPASGQLAKHLKSLGYQNIREYPEGIQGWISAGNPVDKPGAR